MEHQMTAMGLAVTVGLLGACAPMNAGVPGSPEVSQPKIDGTVFTIVFENENAENVLTPAMPYFYELSQKYGTADAYVTNIHPSLPNYIMMTSGSTYGITETVLPAAHPIDGTDNLADQLERANVPWRAYAESMGEPCKMTSNWPYVANHVPWLYYTSVTNDKARCREHVVDFDQSFFTDLDAGKHRYMWVTPNQCSNMHDCPPEKANEWLSKVLPRILASPAYQNGGAVFILFDEGHVRILNASANLATIVISPQLVHPGFHTSTRFDHRSYLATIQDIFGISRVPPIAGTSSMAAPGTSAATGTMNAVPLSEFFLSR
jgi:hypothetical protein